MRQTSLDLFFGIIYPVSSQYRIPEYVGNFIAVFNSQLFDGRPFVALTNPYSLVGSVDAAVEILSALMDEDSYGAAR